MSDSEAPGNPIKTLLENEHGGAIAKFLVSQITEEDVKFLKEEVLIGILGVLTVHLDTRDLVIGHINARAAARFMADHTLALQGKVLYSPPFVKISDFSPSGRTWVFTTDKIAAIGWEFDIFRSISCLVPRKTGEPESFMLSRTGVENLYRALYDNEAAPQLEDILDTLSDEPDEEVVEQDEEPEEEA